MRASGWCRAFFKLGGLNLNDFPSRPIYSIIIHTLVSFVDSNLLCTYFNHSAVYPSSTSISFSRSLQDPSEIRGYGDNWQSVLSGSV